MTIGEFFVNLGVKGESKTLNALKSVKDSLTDMSSRGLAAKAAILGSIYALERMTAAAGNYGAGLQNFGVYTESSTKYLQQLREAFRQSNVEASEADTTFKNVQKTMEQVQITGQAPAGLATIFAEMGAPRDLSDTKEVIEKVIGYIQKYKNQPNKTAVVNDFAQQMGFTEGAIITSRKFTGEIDKITNNILSDHQMEKLSKVKREWSDFFTILDNFNRRLTSRFGEPIIHFLDEALSKIERLEKALEESWDKTDKKQKEEILFDNLKRFEKEHPGFRFPMVIPEEESGFFKKKPAGPPEYGPGDADALRKQRFREVYPNAFPEIAPPVKAIPGEKTSMLEQNINTTVHIEGGQNNVEDANEIARHVNYALRQLPSQSRAT